MSAAELVLLGAAFTAGGVNAVARRVPGVVPCAASRRLDATSERNKRLYERHGF